MEASIVAFTKDDHFCSGAILAAGDAGNFPQTVPSDVQMSSLQIKKIVSPGQSGKIWFNCNRENNEALVQDIATDQVYSNGFA